MEIVEFRTELDADYAVPTDTDVEDEHPSTSSSSILPCLAVTLQLGNIFQICKVKAL